jgi:hypothetical protein
MNEFPMTVVVPDDQTIFCCQLSVSMRWGEKKLIEFCRAELQMDPRQGGIYLFFNAKRDQLKLIFFSKMCYREISKWLPPGSAPALPVTRNGKRVVVLKRDKLEEILRLGGEG